MLLVSDADDLAQMALGVEPAQGMLEDVELAGLIGDDHRVGEQAARDDRADHGRLRGQPALTQVQAVQMGLPRGLVGKASVLVEQERCDDSFGSLCSTR